MNNRRFLILAALPLGAVTLASSAFGQAGRGLMGGWSLLWEGASDNYTGTLEVTGTVSANVYRGRLTLNPSRGGVVFQDATITVTGNDIRIECSNPSEPTWSPDRFYVVRNGNRLVGYSLDAAGRRGRTIVFTAN